MGIQSEKMDPLNAVSETALLTLKARIIESEKEAPLIKDDKGKEILDKIQLLISPDLRQRVLDRKYSPSLTNYIALRARRFDAYTREFVDEPNALVVSLGCGFDTRYWRTTLSSAKYIEVDLPEVIGLKKDLLGAEADYQMIGCSVLDYSWIEKIAALQKTHLLFLAEGLFMYLPEKDVIALFERLAATFTHSQIVFEIVNRKYTRGFRKKMLESKMKRNSGTMAGSSYTYGLEKAKEIETYATNIRVTEEWSYFEDPHMRPKFMQVFKHFKALSRTQWTIKASIE